MTMGLFRWWITKLWPRTKQGYVCPTCKSWVGKYFKYLNNIQIQIQKHNLYTITNTDIVAMNKAKACLSNLQKSIGQILFHNHDHGFPHKCYHNHKGLGTIVWYVMITMMPMIPMKINWAVWQLGLLLIRVLVEGQCGCISLLSTLWWCWWWYLSTSKICS